MVLNKWSFPFLNVSVSVLPFVILVDRTISNTCTFFGSDAHTKLRPNGERKKVTTF